MSTFLGDYHATRKVYLSSDMKMRLIVALSRAGTLDDNWSLVEDELRQQGVIFYGGERPTMTNVDTMMVRVFPEVADVTLVTDDNYEAVATKYRGSVFMDYNRGRAVQIHTRHGIVVAYSGEYLVVANNGLTFSCNAEELKKQTF